MTVKAHEPDPFNTGGRTVYRLRGIQWWIFHPASVLLRLYAASWRFRLSPESRELLSRREPRVIALWHNRSLIAPFFFLRFWPATRPACLISASRAAAWEAAFFEQLKIPVIRGSTTRRSVQALLALRRVLQNGGDVALSPDGPAGPLYSLQPGIARLAMHSSVPVYLIDLKASPSIRLPTWDSHLLPLPFARVDVRIRDIRPQELEAFSSQEDARTWMRQEYLEITQDASTLLSS